MIPIIAELDYELCDKDLIPSILHSVDCIQLVYYSGCQHDCVAALLMSGRGFKAKLLTFVSCSSGEGNQDGVAQDKFLERPEAEFLAKVTLVLASLLSREPMEGSAPPS